jgi:hypothetical protein
VYITAERYAMRIASFLRSKMFAALAMVAGIVATGSAAHATGSALPPGLTPADMVTAVGTEGTTWLAVGVAVIVGITLLVAFIHGFTRKLKGGVR